MFDASHFSEYFDIGNSNYAPEISCYFFANLDLDGDVPISTVFGEQFPITPDTIAKAYGVTRVGESLLAIDVRLGV